ncbi:mitochondrial fission ELM1 family protein [Amorphus sp. 3PC139-8]|uniref:mitochondrial fission ELM1 family protein n=1 Tax=Amorphus sp. 3PC139-8 TaxID=2735676 RepID=UPI00345CAA13
MSDAPSTLVIVPAGKMGHEVQCVGVAEALGATPDILRVTLRPPWSWLAPHGPAQPSLSHHIATDADLVLASGRQAIPLARAIARRQSPRPLVVAIQAPRTNPADFDLVWANTHDRLSGPNVITSVTSPNRLTKDGLAVAAAHLRARLPDLPTPWVGVLVGGTSQSYRFGPDEAAALGDALATFAARHDVSLVITPSRRTGEDNVDVLEARLAATPHWIWRGEGDNPLFGIYGGADAFVVTCDSVNMIGEASFTGKPILAWPLPGGRAKFGRFHEAMVAHGAMRWFDGTWPAASYPSFDTTAAVAAAIRERLLEAPGGNAPGQNAGAGFSRKPARP